MEAEVPTDAPLELIHRLPKVMTAGFVVRFPEITPH